MSIERKNKWTFIVHAHTPLRSGTHYLDGLTQAVMQAADAEQAELRAENERLREDRVQHIGDDSIRGMELKDATKRAESAEAEVARLTRLLEQRTAALTRTIDAKNTAEARASAMAARASILAEVPNEGWCYSCGDLVDESDVAPVVARLRGQVARVEAIVREYESHFDEAADKGETTPAHAALLGAAHAIRAALKGDA